MKSLHSCVPVISSSSRVIAEMDQKQHSSLLQQKNSSITGGSSLKHLKQHHAKLQVNSNLQRTVVSVSPHSADPML